MRLAHLHIPDLIPYTRSLRLQNALLERHFDSKDWLRSVRATQSAVRLPTSALKLPAVLPPDPTLLTFSTTPTYTVGRRHLLANPISSEQQAFLTANGAATFHASPRGGLLTYHAPGQLTAYVIADLRRHGITARCWVRMLEESVMRTCGKLNVPNVTTTNDPGVWIADQGRGVATDRKICAIGVQVSRGVTSHGIGLNVFDYTIPRDQIQRFPYPDASTVPRSPGFLSWGFSRIVACGLEGKSVTWLDREGATVFQQPGGGTEAVADVLAAEVMRGLNEKKGEGKETVDAVYKINETQMPGNEA